MDFRSLPVFIVLGLANEISGCIPESVKLAVFVNVAGMNGDQRNQSEHITKGIVSSLHSASTVHIDELSYTVKEIASFQTSSGDSSWTEKIQFTKKDTGSNSYSIYSSTIDRELEKIFSFGSYRTVAEFVVFLVSDKTELDFVSSMLKKKKTFVVVFGSSVPTIFKTAASRGDYLFQVQRNEDLVNVTDKIKEQIACDSNQYCDTDSYSLGKGSKCNSCVPPCLQNTDICTQRCLFMHPDKFEEGGKISETSENSEVQVLIEDHKYLVIGAVIGAAIFVLVLMLIVKCCFCKYCKNCKKIPLTPSSSDQTIPKTSEPVTRIDSVAVQVQPENEELLGDQNATDGEGPHCSANVVSERNEDRIVMTFKNNREVDQNLYADRDHYQSLH